MGPNRFVTRRSEGRVPVGHMLIEFGSRNLAKLLDTTDLDFVIIDTEHSGFGLTELANLLAWFKASQVAPFVRVPQADYHLIARTLDLGAQGVMVPNVKTADVAAAAVAAAKYAPLGSRGVMFGGTLTDFEGVDAAAYMARANRNTTVICQIESEEGLEHLGGIAATSGVDTLWLGQGDLTIDMGIPGRFEDERFIAAAERVVNAAREHGLGAGIQPRTLAQAAAWIKLGFDVVSFSADAFVYRDALREHVKSVRALIGGA